MSSFKIFGFVNGNVFVIIKSSVYSGYEVFTDLADFLCYIYALHQGNKFHSQTSELDFFESRGRGFYLK